MDLSQLKPAPGATRDRKRVGRGNASGKGTTAGKGTKGQQSRSGKALPYRGFEGGQARLYRKLARKRGFINQFRVEYEPVNVGDLARFGANAVVTPETLAGAGLIKQHPRMPVKVLAGGDIELALTVRAHKFSAAAKDKIEAAGGRVESLDGAEPSVGRRKSSGAVANGGGEQAEAVSGDEDSSGR
jgi:large subunit ribosomal protein L15